jgi:DNA repair exonuclease SbcCD ATPase subunit
MIIFQNIRWKNFLSTGNVFTELALDKHSNTLIVGENGAGKSTLLDAITFALFGKPYRNINKPQLVNSINNKDCLVELEFKLGEKQYQIRRGIKPNLFEIKLDGELLNQDSKAKDYQDMLERLILKMNHKSFTQIVILGSASFTPFMQLNAADRRAVIEDLLDIQIFSNMNSIVKDKVNGLKTEINELKIRLDNVKEKIELHKKHIEEMKKNNQEMVDAKQIELEENRTAFEEYRKQQQKTQDEIDALLAQVVDLAAVKTKNNKLISFEAKIQQNISKAEKEYQFYHDNDNCPTCKQVLEEGFKGEKVSECEKKIQEYNTGLDKLKEEQNAVLARLTEIEVINKTISSHQANVARTSVSVSHLQKYNNNLQKEIERLSESKSISADTKEESKKLVEEYTGYLERRKVATEEKQYYDIAAQLLKDGGIKAKIIKQYLPVINKLVNKYLASMDFFVNFNIDEEFKETIKSRHRDDFSYENFSEGEKQKIDLSLLLTWRAIARMKNSVNTNLLILDETFDSSLDGKGTDSLLQILQTLPDNTNVFVISHKDQLFDKFANAIRFEKKQNFSRIAP